MSFAHKTIWNVHYKPRKAFLEPTLTRREPIQSIWKWMDPDSSESCLGYYLKHMGYAVAVLTKSSISRAIWPPWQYAIQLKYCSSCSSNASNLLCLLKSQLLELVPGIS